MSEAILFGAGGHARVVRSLLGDRYRSVRTATTAGGSDCLSEDEIFADPDRFRAIDFYVAIGNNDARKRIFLRLDKAGLSLPNCVASSAHVAPEASLGRGVVVCPGSVVMPFAVLGDNVIVNTLSSIDHDCRVGNHSQITAGVTFGGTTTVGESCFFGVKSATIPGVTLGDDTFVMAGSVVVKDCAGRATLGGIPARVMKRH